MNPKNKKYEKNEPLPPPMPFAKKDLNRLTNFNSTLKIFAAYSPAHSRYTKDSMPTSIPTPKQTHTQTHTQLLLNSKNIDQ